MLARGKHSSLLQPFVNTERKKFYNIDNWSTSPKEALVEKVAAAARVVNRLLKGSAMKKVDFS